MMIFRFPGLIGCSCFSRIKFSSVCSFVSCSGVMSLIIKETSGRSAAEWIDAYVLTEAKTLLKFTTMSIQEVAYALNFSSQSFFGKYFKHLTGMSPSEYKLSEGRKGRDA